MCFTSVFYLRLSIYKIYLLGMKKMVYVRWLKNGLLDLFFFSPSTIVVLIK